mgnify:CR=1 FL=1
MKKQFSFLAAVLCTLSSIAQTSPEVSGINCKSDFHTDVYPGEKLCFTICTSDADEGDQVSISASFDIKEASFDILNKGAVNEYGRFCWTAGENAHVNSPYLIHFTAKDLTGLTSTSTVEITVGEIAKITSAFTEGTCGAGILSVDEQSNDVIRSIGIGKKTYPFTSGTTNYYQISGLETGENTIEITTFTTGGYNPQFYQKVNIQGGQVFGRHIMDEYQCPGKSVSVPVFSALKSGTSFVWDDGSVSRHRQFQIKNDSVAYIYGQNGTCKDTLKVLLNVANIEASFTASPGIGNVPLEVSFENQSGEDANEFYWEFGDGGFSREQNPTHTFTTAGDYTVTLESKRNGIYCKSTMQLENYINAFPVGLPESTLENKLSIYPNPAREYIYVDTKGIDINDAYIMDARGRKLAIAYDRFNEQIGFDIEPLDLGSYFVVLKSTQGLLQEAFVVGP